MTSNSRSLRSRILLRIVPPTVLLFFITSYWTVQTIVSGFSGEVRLRLDSNAKNFSQSAAAQLQEAMNANVALAKNHLVVNSIVDSGLRDSALEPFFGTLVLPGSSEQLVVMTNYRGNPMAASEPAMFDVNRSPNVELEQFESLSQAWKRDVLESEQMSVTAHDGYLVIAAPVKYSGKTEGAVVFMDPLPQFFDDLLEESESTVYGFEHLGQVFASSDPQLMALGESPVPPAGWISSQAEVSGLPGLRVQVYQTERTIAEASSAVTIAMGIYCVSWSLGVLLAVSLASLMVTRPLEKLASRFREVQTTGDLTLRVSEQGPLELAKLSGAFNQMLGKLDRTTVSREAYRTLALVARYTDNGVIITDPAGRIEWVNDGFTRMTGFEFEESIARKPGAFLQGPDTDVEVVQAMRRAIAEGQGFDVEVLNYHKNGTPYWVAIETRPIVGADGNLEKFIAIEKDITLRKKNEAEKQALARELQDSARAAGMAEIANGVLHNVGNVLNNINISAGLLSQNNEESQLGLLQDAYQVLAEQRDDLAHFLTQDDRGSHFLEFLESVVNALVEEQKTESRELGSLVENISHIKEIITFQQAYSKRGGLIEPVNLPELLDGVIKLHSDRIHALGIQVRRDYQCPGLIQIDKHRLLQILINLVTNAKQALRESPPQGREISLAIHIVEDIIEIAVRDNGTGISSENLGKIFQHGFTTKKDGHGFGLHSSALAAREMGGRLQVSSPGVGLGAEFVLTIPHKPVQPIAHDAATGATQPGATEPGATSFQVSA